MGRFSVTCNDCGLSIGAFFNPGIYKKCEKCGSENVTLKHVDESKDELDGCYQPIDKLDTSNPPRSKSAMTKKQSKLTLAPLYPKVSWGNLAGEQKITPCIPGLYKCSDNTKIEGMSMKVSDLIAILKTYDEYDTVKFNYLAVETKRNGYKMTCSIANHFEEENKE